MTVLTELQDLVVLAAETVRPSVVAVGRGAGLVVATDRVLTNAHNLTAATGLQVRFADGAHDDGEVAGTDLDGDLAVVAVPTGDRPVADWGDEAPALGTAVVAFGAPRRGPGRVTVGFVSAVDQTFRGPRDRRVHGAFEHTAPVGRGSSGGPVVGPDGRVVGIDTHRRGDGLYLAIPTSPALRERVAELGRGQAPVRRHLGVAVAPSEVAARLRAAVGLAERSGVLVRAVENDSPAAAGGLQVGDLVVAAAGEPVREPEDLLRALDAADATLEVDVVRGSDEVRLTVPL